jgi:putative phosphoesterase
MNPPEADHGHGLATSIHETSGLELTAEEKSRILVGAVVMTEEEERKDGYLIGVISDTHGQLRAEAAEVLKGVDLIIHAGDIGKPEVLAALDKIAPVHAVRGNMDGHWAFGLPETEVVEVGDLLLYVLHDVFRLDIDPVATGVVAIIHGHTHTAAIENRKGVLYLNPGSAASFKSTPTVALLRISGKSLQAEVVEL